MSGWEIALLAALCIAFAVAVGYTVYRKLRGGSCCDGCDGCCGRSAKDKKTERMCDGHCAHCVKPNIVDIEQENN